MECSLVWGHTSDLRFNEFKLKSQVWFQTKISRHENSGFFILGKYFFDPVLSWFIKRFIVVIELSGVQFITVIELSGVQFGLRSYEWFKI